MLSESVDRQQITMDKVTISTTVVVLKHSRLHTKFQGHYQLVLEKKILKVFTIYWCGRHLGHVTKPSCTNSLIHYSQKLSHDIWFQITQQILRITRFKFEDIVTFGKGQIMTLTFDVQVASLNHLV